MQETTDEICAQRFQHYLTGRLTTKLTVYALRERPVAVASKGKAWVFDPEFKG